MQAMERQRFLLSAGLEFDKSHMILAATVYMWPAKVKVHQKNSAGLVDKRKKELITLTVQYGTSFTHSLCGRVLQGCVCVCVCGRGSSRKTKHTTTTVQ